MEIFIQVKGRLAGSFLVRLEKLTIPRIVVMRKRTPVRAGAAVM